MKVTSICDPLPTPTTTNGWELREDLTSRNLLFLTSKALKHLLS